MSLEDTEKALGYNFKDKRLLVRALTLSSADNGYNNETFEFFGDAILEFLVSEIIFDQNGTEGQLTDRRKALVSDSSLKKVSVKLGLDKALIKSKGDNNNKKSVPSAYEAVIAAIYLDGGLEAARAFVRATLDFSFKGEVNYKGELQEKLQRMTKECPTYDNENLGTPQKSLYRASVTVFGQTFYGEGENKQQAEQAAAKSALKNIKNK